MRGPQLSEFAIEGVHGGMDCRPNLVSNEGKIVRQLIDAKVESKGNVLTRPPLLKMSGGFASNSGGLIYNKGAFYTFAARGSSVTHTNDVATNVTTLYFDNPEYTDSTSFEVLQAGVYENKAYAWIRHAYQSASGLVPTRIILHLWDSKPEYPTYVTDGATPVDWTLGQFPQNAYGKGDGIPGSWADWSPITAISSDKLWVSTGSGKAAFSGIGRGRVWNARTADDIEKLGAMYYGIHTGSGTNTVVIPEEYADFTSPKFAGWIVESLSSDGSWTKLTHTSGTPSAGEFKESSSTPVWATTAKCAITVGPMTEGTAWRIRVLVVPEVVIGSGGTLNPPDVVLYGDGSTYQFDSTLSYKEFINAYSVKVNSVAKSTDYYTVVNDSDKARVDFVSTSGTFSEHLINSVTAVSIGSGFLTSDIGGIYVGTFGIGTLQPSFTPQYLGLVSASIVSGGGGYVVNDIVNLSGGVGGIVSPQIKVTGTSGGAITTFTIQNAGKITSYTNPVGASGGSGAGATFNFTSLGVTQWAIATYGSLSSFTNPVSIANGATANLSASGTLSSLVVQSPLSVMTDTDFGGAKVIIDGTVVACTFTSASSTSTLVYAPADYDGKPVIVRLIPPLNVPVVFTADTYLVSGGTLIYEQGAVTFSGLLKSALSASKTYLIGATPSGVIAYDTSAGVPTGDQRYRSKLLATVITDGSGNITSITEFQYEKDAQSQWYSTRHQDNLDYWAGTNEAGFLNTDTHDLTGAHITAMIPVKNRIVICYPRTTELWQTDSDLTNVLFIDRYDFGTKYEGVLFYNRPVICTPKGFRAFDLTGLNFQSLEDTNIGEPIQDLGQFVLGKSSFIPWSGGYIAYATLVNCDRYAAKVRLPPESPFYNSSLTGFAYLSFSKESQIMAWSWWNIDPGSPSAIIPIDDKIYMRCGNDMYYFDDRELEFVDYTGVTITSTATWHYIPIDSYRKNKRFMYLDVVANGEITVSYNMGIWSDSGLTDEPGSTISSVTPGSPKIPLWGTGCAITLSVSCSDPAGLELQSLSIQYRQLGR